MKIFLPEKVNFIINKLKENGYEAYAVGGCVRDSVLGRVPDDWDITTSATPNETKALFRRTFDTGIEHGDNYGAGRQRGVRGDNIPCGWGNMRTADIRGRLCLHEV